MRTKLLNLALELAGHRRVRMADANAVNRKLFRHWAFVWLAIVGSGSVAGAGQAAEPAPAPEALGFPRPSPEPALPAGFEPFTLPAFPSLSDPRLPTIAESSRQAGPGDAVALAGSHLDEPTTRYAVFGSTATGGARLLPATAIAANPLGAVVTLPAALADNGMYLLWAGGGDRHTLPVAINRTDAWWIGPSAARAGATASIYGRNLVPGPAAKIYLKTAGGGGRWIDAIAPSNPYKLDFVVPRDLGQGSYEVWVHNGRGGHYGWSGPLKLDVIPDPDAWSGVTVNVKQFGAVGDGKHDDGDALAKAAQAAERMPRSTILLPRGTYLVRAPLAPPSNVRWLGEGSDGTTIMAAPDFVGEGLIAVPNSGAGRGSNSAFGAFTLDGRSQVGKGTFRALVVLHGQRQIRFDGMRFRSAGQQAIGTLQNASRLFFDRCDFIGGILFAGGTSQLFITRSAFQLGPDIEMSVQVVGGGEVAVSQNSFRTLDPLHTGLGRAFVIQSWGGAVSNIYFGDNRTDRLATGPNTKEQNAGEQVMFEMNGVTFASDVASATPSGAVVARITRNEPAAIAGRRNDVAILSGTGAGQVRRIVAFDGANSSLTVDPPWRVVPDATSRLVAGGFLSHAVVYRNTFVGLDDWHSRVSASSGVVMGGNAYDNIIDANSMNDVLNGVYLSAMNFEQKSGSPFQVSYFNLVRNNRIANVRLGIATFTSFNKNASPGDIGLIGNAYRGNQTRNTLQSAFLAGGCNRIEGGLQLFNIVAGNQSSGAGAYFALNNRMRYLRDNIKPPAAVGPGWLIIDNRATGDAAEQSGIVADSACPYYAAGNSWQTR